MEPGTQQAVENSALKNSTTTLPIILSPDRTTNPAHEGLAQEFFASVDVDEVGESLIGRQPSIAGRTSLVGSLCSVIVHMLLLISLGLLFVVAEPPGAMELAMTIANTSEPESFESFNVSIEPSTAEAAASSSQNLTDKIPLEIVEPELDLELGAELAVVELVDPVAGLNDAVKSPGGKESGDKSNSKRGSFFGAQAYGDEFVYVVDMSTSMGERSSYGRTRFEVARRELLRSINELKPSQKFCVFMFCYRTRVMFDQRPRMLRATSSNKHRLAMWVKTLTLGAGTDPRLGTMMALRLKPDAIFLLSDGEFNGQAKNLHAIRKIDRSNRS